MILMTLALLAQELKAGRLVNDYDQDYSEHCIIGLLFKSMGMNEDEVIREINLANKGQSTILTQHEFDSLWWLSNWPDKFFVQYMKIKQNPNVFLKMNPDGTSVFDNHKRQLQLSKIAGERIEYFLATGE